MEEKNKISSEETIIKLNEIIAYLQRIRRNE